MKLKLNCKIFVLIITLIILIFNCSFTITIGHTIYDHNYHYKILNMLDNENTIDYFGNKYDDECDCITPNGNFSTSRMVRNIRMDRNEEPISIDTLNRCLIGDTIMNRNEKSNVDKKDHEDSIIATIDR